MKKRKTEKTKKTSVKSKTSVKKQATKKASTKKVEKKKTKTNMAYSVCMAFITVVFVKDRSCYETTDKKSERTTIKDAIHVILGNDQLKVQHR